jgi:hypothetical protein
MALSSEFFSAVVSFVITILILSYLIGDNPLFRAAIYIFVGVSAGYVTAVAWNQVIMPQLLQPIFSGEVFSDFLQAVLLAFPLLGSALLLTKASPRLSNLGQIPVAYLAGVGAAVAIGGATLGTLFPQITATFNNFDSPNAFEFLNGSLILLGVVGTLAYFHYGAKQESDGTAKRNIFIKILTWVGRVYIAITFGVLFAGVYMAALTALIERMDSIRIFISQLF